MSVKINSEQFRHLLTPAIVELSQKIQTSTVDPQQGDVHQYLKIENEALEHIGFLVLNVFNSILEVNYNVPTPEIASSILNTSKDTSSVGSTLNSTILDLAEAENRCRLTMPHVYINDACKKAYKVVEKCRGFMNTPKRTKLLKAISDLYSSSSSSSLSSSAAATFTSHLTNTSSAIYVSSTNPDLEQQFTLPIDDIHAILSKKIFFYKFDLFVTIFLVSILETVCTDILKLAIHYVRHLGRYNITKSDVVISIQIDDIIAKVLSSDNSSDPTDYPDIDFTHDRFEFNNLNDDLEDEVIFGDGYYIGDEKSIHSKLVRSDVAPRVDPYNPNEDTFISEDTFAIVTKSTDVGGEGTKASSLTLSASNGLNNSCEDVTSDSSTLCPESISPDQLNKKYNEKVKELIQEQNQYLQDLNVLRRIFVVLFKRCCHLFGIKLNSCDSEAMSDAELDPSNSDQIESMFGNINDVYECSLRLADLLDDSVNSTTNPLVSSSTTDLLSPCSRSNGSSPLLMVGQQFWDIAEGEEFSVYTKYAKCVTDFAQFNACVALILSNPNAQRLLQQYNCGLVEISKYLLPKLLTGSIYHVLYLTETVDYLHHCATDEEDKTCLKDTLDTLKKIRYELSYFGEYSHFCFKPIETSLRMSFGHQFFQQCDRSLFGLADGSNLSSVFSLASSSSTTTITSSASPSQKLYNTNQALVANMPVLTQRKKSELENRVESFKWPAYINQPLVQLSTTPIQNETTVRNPYLFEKSIHIHRSSQPVQSGSQKMSAYLQGQTKLKIQKRHAYLFDGCLILTKRDYYGKNPVAKYLARYKQAISLDKCILKDCDDDLCFELQVQSTNSGSNISQGHRSNNSSSSSAGSTSSQEQEFIIVKCDNTRDKYEWMSMLCYTQYKFSIDRLLQQMTEEQNHEFTLPIPPKGYIFDLPDSPETVVISENHSISEATLVKLVERMTHHEHFNTKLRHEFLMCYREFCSSHELFELLVLRYDVPDLELDQATLDKFLSGGIVEREVHKRYRRKYQEPIRLNVINVIKHWIRYYSAEDFVNDPHLLQMLREFSQHVGNHNQRLQQQLLNIMNKKLNGQENMNALMMISDMAIKSKHNICQSSRSSSTSTADDSVSSFSTSTQSTRLTDLTSEPSTSTSEPNPCMYMDEMPAFESHLETSFPYDLLTVHPLELARQATLIEWEIFKRIKPNEFTTVGWMKKDQETKNKLSPNLVRMMNMSNRLTNWYTKWIVDTMSLDERVAVILRLLDIAEYFDEMNNFSGMKEIFSALEMAAVIRLKTTIDVSKIEQHKMYHYLKDFFGDHDHEYFRRLKKCNPPCLPFLGSFLTIISKKKDYHVLYASQQPHNLATMSFMERAQVHLIGFGNWRLIVDCVTELMNFQNISYNYRVHDKIRSFIFEDIGNMYRTAHNASETVESDENAIANWLYERSLHIEPKDKPALDYPRFNKYSLKPPPPSDKNNNKISNSNKNYSHSSLSSLSKTDSMHKNMNKLARAGDRTKHGRSAAQEPATSSVSTSRNIFQKRSSINSTIQQLKLPSQTNLSSPSLSPSPSPSPTFAKYTSKHRQNPNNNMSASSTVLSLVSTSASQMSSSQPISSIAPFGSIYSPTPTSQASNTFFSSSNQQGIGNTWPNANSSSTTNLADQQSSRFNPQGTQKLSFSSADSSSSAPNSPPPGYDEVFTDTSEFVPNNNNNNKQPQDDLPLNKNCYDNKTYFQRIDPQLSASMSNLNNDETQQFASPYKDRGQPALKPFLKSTKSNQPSVFSFPYLEGQNEDVKMSSRTSSTDFFSTSSSMQSSPLLAPDDMYINKKPFNSQLPPPPVAPPPPPPDNPPAIPTLPPHLQSIRLQHSPSQTSLSSQSTPPPPIYPPPPSDSVKRTDSFNARQPPPIPTRPGKNNTN